MIHKIRFFFKILWLGWLLAGVLTIVPGASAHAAENPSAARLPMAVVTQASHTFGTVMEGVEIKHDFIIENKGSGVLEIKKVVPD